MKKKYLFIYGQLNRGGAEKVLLDILNNFDYGKYDVDLLQIIEGGTLIDELPKQVNRIHVWHDYTLSYKIANRLSLYFMYNKILRENALRALNGTCYDVAISFLEGMPLKIHSKIPNIAARNYSWVHCDLNKFRYEASVFSRNEEEASYNLMNEIIFVSNDAKIAFQNRFPKCKSDLKVIYNPIDFDKINLQAAEYKISNHQFTIVVVGRLSKQKGLNRVIELAKNIKENHLPITIQIVGDGELKENLYRDCQKHNLLEIIQFLGYKKNPYPYIKAADILLSTSISEGFSLAICEAMCLKTPVISTKTSGPSEIIDNDKYGLLCEHNEESIYSAVSRLYYDNNLQETLRTRAYQRVKDFSVSKCMAEIYKL